MRLLSSLTATHYRVLAVLWTAGIVVACTLPAGSIPQVQPAFSPDKIVHFGLFAVFGLLWMRGLCPPDKGTLDRCLWRRGFVVFLAGGLFAGGTEIYQQLAPVQRLGDPYDAVANMLGLLLAVGVYYVYSERILVRASPQE